MQQLARSLSMIVLMLCMSYAPLSAAVPRPYPTAKLTISGLVQSGDSGGNIQVDFNGFLEVIHYGPSSTAASIASGLAAMFTRDYRGFGLYAKAGANGNSDPTVVTFQLTNGSTFGTPNLSGPSTSFSFSEFGFGGSPSGTPDVGTVALRFNGTTIATARYGEGSTPASIAAELAQTGNSGQVTVTAEGPNLSLQTKQTGTFSSPYNLIFTSTQSGFSQSSFSASPASGTLTGSSGTAAIPVYSYTLANGSSSGYDATGNVLSMTDSVMGSWSYGYDNLNRLTNGQASAGPYAGQSACWSYDSFGNRTSQSVSSSICGNSPTATFAATYNTSNRISSVSSPAGISISYDAAGNVTNDGNNTYIYDAEGRVCAVHGPQGMTGYLYNADGNRVAKGTIANMNSCDPTQNGFVPTNDYVLDQSGGQMTEVAWTNGVAIPQHTNVTANGVLIATADNQGWHFHLNDPLGSRRVQADAAGFPEQSCQSLPFGDQLFCTSSASFPTEHHFTGKERDAESGLDYFGARYMSSNMGRFMSPDYTASDDGADPIPYADLTNPQSLNLYSYVRNNPLSHVDADGHDCVHINVDSGAYEGTDRGDCDNSTEEKANSGHYVDGTVDTINENRSGQVTGFSGTSYSGNLLSGAFASPLPYGPLEGPANQAGLNLLSNSAGVVNAAAGLELDAAGLVFPIEHLAVSALSGRYQPGVQAAGISRKPGTLGQFGDNTRENKIARDIAKKLGLGKDGEQVVHGLLQEGSQMAEKPLTFTEGLNYVRQALGLIE